MGTGDYDDRRPWPWVPFDDQGVAECCGCSCGECLHQGGSLWHRSECAERFEAEWGTGPDGFPLFGPPRQLGFWPDDD
jgi:hypothetical protein